MNHETTTTKTTSSNPITATTIIATSTALTVKKSSTNNNNDPLNATSTHDNNNEVALLVETVTTTSKKKTLKKSNNNNNNNSLNTTTSSSHDDNNQVGGVTEIATTNSKNKNSKFCDVCWGKDGYRNMILQTCSVCRVSVHNECYGIDGNENFMKKKSDFKCWACQSIGTTIKVRERDPMTKKRLEYPINERPTECILCSVDDGTDWYHAMHPVYDHYGVKGRQILLEADRISNKPTRLAWAHTLCAFALGAHPIPGGCVYGCTQDGSYDGIEEEEEDENDEKDDDNSVNSLLDVDLEDPSDNSIHHFCYVLPDRKTGLLNPWTKAIEQFQLLKCYLCGKNDNNNIHNVILKNSHSKKRAINNKDNNVTTLNKYIPVKSYRIPLQCCANSNELVDGSEFLGFLEERKCNCPDTYDGQCYVSAHIGCAMWSKNDDNEYPSYRRLYFYPGAKDPNDKYQNAVTNFYCNLHTEQLGTLARNNLRYPNSNKTTKKLKGEQRQHPAQRMSSLDTIEGLASSKRKVLSSKVGKDTFTNQNRTQSDTSAGVVLNDEEKKKLKKMDVLEQRKKRREQTIALIQKDLKSRLSRFTLQEIQSRIKEYRDFARKRFMNWRSQYQQTDIGIFTRMFNQALNNALRELHGSLFENINETIEHLRVSERPSIANDDIGYDSPTANANTDVPNSSMYSQVKKRKRIQKIVEDNINDNIEKQPNDNNTKKKKQKKQIIDDNDNNNDKKQQKSNDNITKKRKKKQIVNDNDNNNEKQNPKDIMTKKKKPHIEQPNVASIKPLASNVMPGHTPNNIRPIIGHNLDSRAASGGYFHDKIAKRNSITSMQSLPPDSSHHNKQNNTKSPSTTIQKVKQIINDKKKSGKAAGVMKRQGQIIVIGDRSKLQPQQQQQNITKKSSTAGGGGGLGIINSLDKGMKKKNHDATQRLSSTGQVTRMGDQQKKKTKVNKTNSKTVSNLPTAAVDSTYHNSSHSKVNDTRAAGGGDSIMFLDEEVIPPEKVGTTASGKGSTRSNNEVISKDIDNIINNNSSAPNALKASSSTMVSKEDGQETNAMDDVISISSSSDENDMCDVIDPSSLLPDNAQSTTIDDVHVTTNNNMVDDTSFDNAQSTIDDVPATTTNTSKMVDDLSEDYDDDDLKETDTVAYYSQTIVLEIVAKYELQLTRFHQTSFSINDSINRNQDESSSEPILEDIWDEVKDHNKTKLLSLFPTTDQYNIFWEQVIHRVCTQLNYFPKEKIDWSFLLNGSDVLSTTNTKSQFATFLDDWDTYQKI